MVGLKYGSWAIGQWTTVLESRVLETAFRDHQEMTTTAIAPFVSAYASQWTEKGVEVAVVVVVGGGVENDTLMRWIGQLNVVGVELLSGDCYYC